MGCEVPSTTLPLPTAEFEPATPASKWPQTHTLHRAATEIGVGSVNPEFIAQGSLLYFFAVIRFTFVHYVNQDSRPL